MKIRPVVAEFRVDGRTDRHTTELIVAFFSFTSACNKIGVKLWAVFIILEL
jgi:hypothetical protein